MAAHLRHNNNNLVLSMRLGVSPSDFHTIQNDPRFKDALGAVVGYEYAKEQEHQTQVRQAWLQSQLEAPRPEPRASTSEEKPCYSALIQHPVESSPPAIDFAALINTLVKRQKKAIRNHHKHNQAFTKQLSDVFKQHRVIYASGLTHETAAEKFQLMIHNIAETVFAKQIVQHLPRPEPGRMLDDDFKHDAGFQHQLKLETIAQHAQTAIQQFCQQYIVSCEHKQSLIHTMTQQACHTYQKHMYFLMEMHQCDTHIAQIKLNQQAQQQAIQDKPLALLPDAPNPKPYKTPAEEFQAALTASNSTPSFFDQRSASKRDEEEENNVIQSILYNRRMTPRPGPSTR